jgi:putative transposase
MKRGVVSSIHQFISVLTDVAVKNEGLRLLALGISATTNRGSVNPKGSGRKKSMNPKVAPIEIGSPCSICTQMSVR